MLERYDRNIQFFGEKGQKIISETRVAIAGVGGLGTHVAQQLAYLGVGSIALIDKEDFDETNSNRLNAVFEVTNRCSVGKIIDIVIQAVLIS